jgi:hypothetical protein
MIALFRLLRFLEPQRWLSISSLRRDRVSLFAFRGGGRDLFASFELAPPLVSLLMMLFAWLQRFVLLSGWKFRFPFCSASLVRRDHSTLNRFELTAESAFTDSLMARAIIFASGSSGSWSRISF